MMPFTLDTYLDIIRSYNLSLWPSQVFFYLLGILTVVLSFRGVKAGDRIVSSILALMWLMNGFGFHMFFSSRVHPLANIFSFLLILQGGLLFTSGVIKDQLAFHAGRDIHAKIGLVLIGFSLIVYPAIGLLAGRSGAQVALVGAFPAPTAIFTFGLLLIANRVPKYLLVIPLLEALAGFRVALDLNIIEDFSLLPIGVGAVLLIAIRDRQVDQV